MYAQRQRIVRQHFACGCKPGRCRGLEQESEPWGGRWSRCPIGVMDLDPLWSEVVTLQACARISPLAQWPQGYAASVVSGLISLRAELDREEARQIRKASGG